MTPPFAPVAAKEPGGAAIGTPPALPLKVLFIDMLWVPAPAPPPCTFDTGTAGKPSTVKFKSTGTEDVFLSLICLVTPTLNVFTSPKSTFTAFVGAASLAASPSPAAGFAEVSIMANGPSQGMVAAKSASAASSSATVVFAGLSSSSSNSDGTAVLARTLAMFTGSSTVNSTDAPAKLADIVTPKPGPSAPSSKIFAV